MRRRERVIARDGSSTVKHLRIPRHEVHPVVRRVMHLCSLAVWSNLHALDALESHRVAPLDRRDGTVAIVLFVWAFGTHWLSAGGELYGDESWYFYLAHSFGIEPAAAVDHPLFHLLNRPLYYAVFHLGTYSGMTGFRNFAGVVGALVVVVCFGVARTLGATRLSAEAAEVEVS